jgi:hypothetical protein
MIPNSSPLMGGWLLHPQRKLEKDSFAVDPSSIIKLEACDHVEEITKGGGMYFRQMLKLNGFPQKEKRFAAENIPFLNT